MMKILLLSLFIQILLIVPAKTSGFLTLQECQELARANYSNLKNQVLYQDIYELKTGKWQTNWLPQLSLNGQVMYQSDVFQLPFTPPGIEIVKLPHERYQASLDVSQPIYDGGVVRAQKMLEREQMSIQMKDIDVELHQVKTAVNEVFFSILLMQKTDSILISTIDLLQEKERALKSAIQGGIAASYDLLRLETETLKVRQQMIENEHGLKSSIQVLEILIGQKIGGDRLVEPDPIAIPEDLVPDRPEIRSLTARQEMMHFQQHLANTNLRPRVSLFASAGVGYPNPFNFYEVDISPFYVLGAKANWKIWDWQSTAKENQIIKVQAEIMENNKINIDRGISLQLSRANSEEEKYRRLMGHDKEMVVAREKIRQLSSMRFDEGIISSSEYLDDVNAEKLARINLEIHKIKWIKAGINVLTELGMEYK
jgi:outer membrane protein TolC